MTLQNSSDAKIEVIRQPQQLPCSYIDAQGREVQITEEMIQQACSELEENWSSLPSKAETPRSFKPGPGGRVLLAFKLPARPMRTRYWPGPSTPH